MLEVVPVRFDQPDDFHAWQAYMDGCPESHCADRAEWRLLFRELYGIEDLSFLVRDGDGIAGALSVYHIRSPFLGNMLVSCPFFGYGGLHAGTDQAAALLIDRALAAARERRVDYLELRLMRRLEGAFRANPGFAEFRLDLGDTSEETWSERLDSNVRQNIRKARAQDLEFRLRGDPRPCFELLCRTLRAHGTPFHGWRLFELLLRHLGDRVLFSEVRHQGHVVAAGVVIRHRDTLVTPYIGSLEQFRHLRANYLQYWGIIENAHRTGVRRFDMGRSPRGSTHARFKKKWGCRELEIAYQYQVISPRKPYRSVSRPTALQVLGTRIWRHLPLVLTTALGPRLARHIP